MDLLRKIRLAVQYNIPRGLFFFVRRKVIVQRRQVSRKLRTTYPLFMDETVIKEILAVQNNFDLKQSVLQLADRTITGNVGIYHENIDLEDYTVDKYEHNLSVNRIKNRDLRFYWEIYRGKYLFFVGLAYLLTGNSKYSEFLIDK